MLSFPVGLHLAGVDVPSSASERPGQVGLNHIAGNFDVLLGPVAGAKGV